MVEEVVTVKYKCGICETVYDTHANAIKCEESGKSRIHIKDMHGERVTSWGAGDYLYDLSTAHLYRIRNEVMIYHNIYPQVINSRGEVQTYQFTAMCVVIHKGVYKKLVDAICAFEDLKQDNLRY